MLSQRFPIDGQSGPGCCGPQPVAGLGQVTGHGGHGQLDDQGYVAHLGHR